jgi:ParB-like chromosome segregation protein Spo0J
LSHTEYKTRPIRSIYPNPDNPRVHSKKQIRQIAAAIKQLGLINPFIVNEKGMILTGNGRYAAVQELGIDQVPVAVVSGLTS